MHTAPVVITLFTAAVTAAIAVADFVPARFVLANSAGRGPMVLIPTPDVEHPNAVSVSGFGAVSVNPQPSRDGLCR